MGNRIRDYVHMVNRMKKAHKISRILNRIAIKVFEYRNGDIDTKKLKNIISNNFEKILKELE